MVWAEDGAASSGNSDSAPTKNAMIDDRFFI
jgi:hypothetical protein